MESRLCGEFPVHWRVLAQTLTQTDLHLAGRKPGNGLRQERLGPSRPARELRKRAGLKPYPHKEPVTGADRARAGRPSVPVSLTRHWPSGAQHHLRQPRAQLTGAAGRPFAGAGEMQAQFSQKTMAGADKQEVRTRVGLSDLISKPQLPASRPTVSPASRALPSVPCAQRSQAGAQRQLPGMSQGSARAHRSPAFRRPFRELLSFVLILLFLHNPVCLGGRSWHRAKGKYRTNLRGSDRGEWARRGRRGQRDKTPCLKAQ